MSKFGWCLVWPGTPHVNCRRRYKSSWDHKWHECDCPCHVENDEALEELI